MTELPDRHRAPTASERRLSNREFELVIRRAAELQARAAEEPGSEGLTEEEAIRIGRELGLAGLHLQRALAEVRGQPATEAGLLVRLFGPGGVQVARPIPGEAPEVNRRLERYLVEREFLAVLRRFPDRTLFTRATGMVAAMGRASSQIFNRSPLLGVANLETTVHPLEEGFSYVTLATSLSGQRTGAAAASLVSGGTGASVAGAVLGIAIAPPAALLALPILGAAVYGGHVYYESVLHKIEVQLESLLDRLEHGELPPPGSRWGGPRR